MSPIPAAKPDHISVLVADSNQIQCQLLTRALRRRPEFQVISCGMDPDEIQQTMTTSFVHVALMTPDHCQGDMAVLRRLHLNHPEVAKVLLVQSYDRDLVVNAFRSGARGLFCFTEAPFRALCRCIHQVRHGQIWANAEQLQFLIDIIAQVPSLRVVNAQGDQLLTPREEQVVALVAEGLSNRDVAAELRLSEHTIKKYLFRIFDKLGISTRVELVLYAVNHGNARSAQWLAGVS
jgi:DNA-binding NarL/FixJ family response regulator